MFKCFVEDMICPQEARNDPNRQEPVTITDTGMWVWNQSLNIPNFNINEH